MIWVRERMCFISEISQGARCLLQAQEPVERILDAFTHSHTNAHTWVHKCWHFCAHRHTDELRTAHICIKVLFTHTLTHSSVRRADRCMVTGLHCAGLIHFSFQMSSCITAVMNISGISPLRSLSLLSVSVSLSLITSTSTAGCRVIQPSTQPVSHPAKQANIKLTATHQCTCTWWQPTCQPPALLPGLPFH